MALPLRGTGEPDSPTSPRRLGGAAVARDSLKSFFKNELSCLKVFKTCLNSEISSF